MKVAISVGGRFHAFYLARYLQTQGALARLITSYPKYEVARYGVPKSHVTSLTWKELIERAYARFPAKVFSHQMAYLLSDNFDRQAAKRIPPTDICTAWSSFALHTLRRAKSLGALTVVERGSAHIEYQRELLRDEYARWGLVRDVVPPRIVAKEIQEYAEADYIAIPSRFVKRTFVDRGVSPTRLIHVPYGVDVQEFSPGPKAEHVFRVINVGTQGIRKGTLYLLQAFDQLNIPNSELLLVGSMEADIRPLLSKYSHCFRHIPPQPQTKLVNFYSQSDVFVLPSIEDGFGMVIGQAMACGLPVVTTLNTGAADLLDEEAQEFVVPIRDVEALKDRISYLYDHPAERRDIGERARKRVSNGFSWEDYGAQVFAEYRRVMGVAQGGLPC